MRNDEHDDGQLRHYAAECLRMARDADEPEIQALMISMAQKWVEFALHAERLRQATDPARIDPLQPPVPVSL